MAFLGLFINGLCVISQIDHNVLLLTAASPRLVFIMASHGDLSWGRGYILYLLMTFRIVLEILKMSIFILMTLPCPLFGDSVHEVFAALNIIIDSVLQWSKNDQLTIHPIKTEAMLFRKSPFIGPLPPLYFGSGTIRVVESITCPGVKLNDCTLSWSEHVSQARKFFVQKVKAIKRMKHLPLKTLQVIYFKAIFPSITYSILIWGNCSTAPFSSLDSIHTRAARIIFNLDSSISDAECLLNSHWPSNFLFL